MSGLGRSGDKVGWVAGQLEHGGKSKVWGLRKGLFQGCGINGGTPRKIWTAMGRK